MAITCWTAWLCLRGRWETPLHLTRARLTFPLKLQGLLAAALEPEEDNLVFRAAEKLGDLAPGATVSLTKALPVAAGIGGGSADAAATLRGLLVLYGIEQDDVGTLDAMALALGADVPACLRSKALRMMGIGEKISDIRPFPPLPAVLVNPGVAVPTGPIFKALNLGQPSTGGSALSSLPAQGFTSSADVVQWLEGQRNDLQAPAIAIAPEVGRVLEVLSAEKNCRLSRMSGSGATCFGLFDTKDDADQFAAHLADQQPGWWVVSTVFQ